MFRFLGMTLSLRRHVADPSDWLGLRAAHPLQVDPHDYSWMMERRTSIAIAVMLVTVAITVGLWPMDCLTQITHADGIGWSRTTESTTCSSLSGFTWSHDPEVSTGIVVGSVLMVLVGLVVTLLILRRHAGAT